MDPADEDVHGLGCSEEQMRKSRGIVAEDERVVDCRPPMIVRGRNTEGEPGRKIEPNRALPRIDSLIRAVTESLWQIDRLRIRGVVEDVLAGLSVRAEREGAVLRAKRDWLDDEGERPQTSAESSLDYSGDAPSRPHGAVIVAIRKR